jgi:hypothetical protein
LVLHVAQNIRWSAGIIAGCTRFFIDDRFSRKAAVIADVLKRLFVTHFGLAVPTKREVKGTLRLIAVEAAFK